jgi:ATP-binding cassette subfamily C protein
VDGTFRVTAGAASVQWRAARALWAEMAASAPGKATRVVGLLMLLTITEGIGVLLLAPLLALVGVMEDNPLPRAAGWLQAGFATVGVEPTLGSVLLLFVAITGLRIVVVRRQTMLTASVREDIVSAYRVRLYRAMASAEWRMLVTRSPSEFAHVLTSEIGRVGAAITQLTDLAVAVAVAFVYLALALRLSLPMAVLVLGSAGALAWGVRGALDRSRSAGASAAAARAELHGAIAEHVASMKIARSYGALDRHLAEFIRLSNASRAVSLDVDAGVIDLQRALDLGSTVLLAMIVYVSSTVLHVPAALLLVLLFIFARLMPRLITVYRLLQSLAIALPIVDAVNRLEHECRAAAEPSAPSQRDVSLTETIRFDDVSFAYPRRDTVAAVTHVNLAIAIGKTTAIVGPSGSGKSTIADLLIGLLHPCSGRIVIDGEPLAADRMASWRRQVAYVPQDPFLFHDTVRANLVWALPGASDQDLWSALRSAMADQFVAQLPHGLDTVVGERGVLLSGGERQRLAIARALLRRPQLLLLDEATSALDGENELRIQQAVDALQHRMTIVVITHRLSTIRHADMIYVIEGGTVVRSGQWDELVAAGDRRFDELAGRGVL